MNWSVKNVLERAVSTAIFAFVGSFGSGEVVGGVPNSTQLRLALWTTAMATLLSIGKNLTAEGVAVESTKRATKAMAGTGTTYASTGMASTSTQARSMGTAAPKSTRPKKST